MLSFYQIRDEETDWECPDDTAYLGSISLEEHQSFIRFWDQLDEMNLSISFFSDTRLNSIQVVQLHAYLNGVKDDPLSSVLLDQHASLKLLNILTQAKDAKLGIMTFCD